MLQTSSKFFARAVAQRVLTGLAAFVLMVAGVAGIAAHAQLSGTGAISGTVVDPTDAVVAGATVTVTNVDTNVSTVRTTTRAGDYNISALIPGTYTVTVAAAGFEAYKQENVTVNALETVGLNMKLTVGRATETVTIYSGASAAADAGRDAGRDHGQRDVFEPAAADEPGRTGHGRSAARDRFRVPDAGRVERLYRQQQLDRCHHRHQWQRSCGRRAGDLH